MKKLLNTIEEKFFTFMLLIITFPFGLIYVEWKNNKEKESKINKISACGKVFTDRG